ncbi:hypothetical protein H7H48_16200 [Nitratireductor sp. B36]|uniref:hypothetical protein n=1 Tax=Nitratireductor sp. B36 TaxID=2762059 RepID=UPI001E582D07|nr:hypothetical protein [Nitratireductor sp. B36]MCC5780605.1 hypothetical protein [Nitratireductor sp. B36]
MVVSDNGSELTSSAILVWQRRRGVEWHDTGLGKPAQYGFINTFNGGPSRFVCSESFVLQLPLAVEARGIEHKVSNSLLHVVE